MDVGHDDLRPALKRHHTAHDEDDEPDAGADHAAKGAEHTAGEGAHSDGQERRGTSSALVMLDGVGDDPALPSPFGRFLCVDAGAAVRDDHGLWRLRGHGERSCEAVLWFLALEMYNAPT
jgi:hypothetical protein